MVRINTQFIVAQVANFQSFTKIIDSRQFKTIVMSHVAQSVNSG